MSWNDKRIESWVGVMLRTGVILASAMVMAGGILYLVQRPGQPHPSYQSFHGEPESLKTVAGIVQGAKHMEPKGFIMLGILLLILTPVGRVGVCVVGFLLEHDRMYTAVSGAVLLILLYSLVFHR